MASSPVKVADLIRHPMLGKPSCLNLLFHSQEKINRLGSNPCGASERHFDAQDEDHRVDELAGEMQALVKGKSDPFLAADEINDPM
jgi:hypothetical protein